MSGILVLEGHRSAWHVRVPSLASFFFLWFPHFSHFFEPIPSSLCKEIWVVKVTNDSLLYIFLIYLVTFYFTVFKFVYSDFSEAPQHLYHRFILLVATSSTQQNDNGNKKITSYFISCRVYSTTKSSLLLSHSQSQSIYLLI